MKMSHNDKLNLHLYTEVLWVGIA